MELFHFKLSPSFETRKKKRKAQNYYYVREDLNFNEKVFASFLIIKLCLKLVELIQVFECRPKKDSRIKKYFL